LVYFRHISAATPNAMVQQGDFNTILIAHKHRGHQNPSRIPIIGFQSLPHRIRVSITQKEDLIERFAINSCISTICSTLTRVHLDHYPLLSDFQISEVRVITYIYVQPTKLGKCIDVIPGVKA